MAEQIRVAIVDDQQLVRAGFRMLVESQPDMTVVTDAGDGVEALERLQEVTADVVLMDVRMPGSTGWRRPGRSCAPSVMRPRRSSC